MDFNSKISDLTVGQFLSLASASRSVQKPFLTVDDLVVLTGLKKATIYAKHQAGVIPGVVLNSTRLLFETGAVLDWLNSKT